MSPCRLHCFACVYEWHFPRGCPCSCVLSVHAFLCMYFCFCFSLCTCMHMVCICLKKPTLESFNTGPVSSISLPEGTEVEMRDRKTHGKALCTHACQAPVPSSGHSGHCGVFQMDTSVCFHGNKLFLMEFCFCFFFVYVCDNRLPKFHDAWREKTTLELRLISQITCVKMSLLNWRQMFSFIIISITIDLISVVEEDLQFKLLLL